MKYVNLFLFYSTVSYLHDACCSHIDLPTYYSLQPVNSIILFIVSNLINCAGVSADKLCELYNYASAE